MLISDIISSIAEIHIAPPRPCQRSEMRISALPTAQSDPIIVVVVNSGDVSNSNTCSILSVDTSSFDAA